jgi:hypothetical protein
MQVADEPIETLHIYVVPEKKGRQPYTLLPLFAAFLCLTGIIGLTAYSALNPVYETIKIPAHFFPMTFRASQPVIPTGIRNYPATFAHGILTITNGSVIAQQFPAGMIFNGADGVQVITDAAVFVPAGSAAGYGTACVQAHPLISGRKGNISTLDVNAVEGSSVYVRNLTPFTGGQDAWSVKYITESDKQTALGLSEQELSSQISRIKAILKSCARNVTYDKAAHLTLNCLFAAYPHFPYRNVRLEGNNLLVTVIYRPEPGRFPVK